MEYKYDVFISYSSKDQKIVEGMCHYLEERNLRCFVAYRDVPKGGYWGKYISPAIKKSKVFIYVHTSTANESEDTTREIVLALKCKLIVIPFRVEDIEYRDDKEYSLTNLNWLDAFPEEPESYFGNLYDIVKVNFPEREIKNKDDKSNEATVESESIKCPHCSGEHNIGATFCENTGKKLKNACTNKSCSEYNKYVLPGNAKFCLICGQPIVNDTDKLEQKCKQLNDEIEHLKSKISLLEKEAQEKCTECKNKQQKELKNQQQRFVEQEEKRKQEEAVRKARLAEEERKRNEITKRTGTIFGHEYVDLGLSVKWATCNVGANAPEEYGDYFAWGETTTKNSYTAYNSTYDKSMYDISDNASCDAARANWGGSWRLPTGRDLEELKNKCSWKWITQSGVNGYKVIGPNGNSIFLPAAGYCCGSSRDYVGKIGTYWSSSLESRSGNKAYRLYFDSSSRNVHWGCCDCGRTVRPVSK